MTPIFEVRIPTYNRPDLLRRALESLQGQTYPHWVASVYDDASAGEEIVRSIGDKRIRYAQNPRRLGACVQMDRCFSPAAMSGGDYAVILEDDNFWLPEFLASVAQHLAKKHWSLIQANQRIWSAERGFHPATETTRGAWYSAGIIDQVHLMAATLFMQGLSTGGLIWKLDGSCDLRTHIVHDFGLQEVSRSFLVRSPFLFADEAFAVFNLMPKTESARANDSNRKFGRGMQSIRRFIFSRYGREVVDVILAEKPTLTDQLYSLLAHSGCHHLIPLRLAGPLMKASLKGLALRLTQPDPCSDFVTNLKSSPDERQIKREGRLSTA